MGGILYVAHTVAAGQFACALPEAAGFGIAGAKNLTDGQVSDVTGSDKIALGRAPAAAPKPSPGDILDIFGPQEALEKIYSELKPRLGLFARSLTIGDTVLSAQNRFFIRRREAFRTQATILREFRRSQRRAALKGIQISEDGIAVRLKTARQSNLPFLHMHSKSTEQSFRLHFEAIAPDDFKQAKISDHEHQFGKVDIYGFSSPVNPIALPIYA
jgi:hypothetical protein